MPLRGQTHSHRVADDAPYFQSLVALDVWAAGGNRDKLRGVLPYHPRPTGSAATAGNLLICHDYKGGYTEAPSGLCYTFNFWRLCDTFIYFSHHRVAVPPSGWINAAHRQGTRILGTLIFEGTDSQPDCLRLLVGHPDPVVTGNKIPISKHYAVLLAELAYQRGFDGYLLNFEADLPHETDQAHALAAWILLLRAELRAKVGPHAQVVWYDSIIYNGSRWYQNRLDGFNLPFFLAADAFFTNYWWEPDTQLDMIQYFTKLDDELLSFGASSSFGAKTLQSIYSGVDVWPGRGQYGDSGFYCYRAVSHTSHWGFSTALFAPGWTWEGATINPEKNWDKWWDTERRFWLGPLKPGEIIHVPDSPEGPFKPMVAFFQDLPPPDPASFVFYTNFSPGVGYAWFVEGKKVLDTKDDGWSDVDKQCSIGNLVWPWPTPSCRGTQHEVALTASTALDMTDGYNGGNTLKLTLTCPRSGLNDTVKSIWLPVQTLTVSTNKSYQVRIVYKTASGSDIELTPHVDANLMGNSETDLITSEAVVSSLLHGWTQQAIEFVLTPTPPTASVAIGFLVDIRLKQDHHSAGASSDIMFSISLGQLVVYPTPSPQTPASVGTPSVIDAKFVSAHGTSEQPPPSAADGVLTWKTASTFTPLTVDVSDAESTTPAWLLDDTPAYRFPTFLYFNVYAAPLNSHAGHWGQTREVVFVGTTGLDGRENRFYVERACLPVEWDERVGGIRFYVQGVTDRGDVLPWDKCATVDRVIQQ